MIPHRSLFSQYPLVQFALAFSAGICLADHLSAGSRILLTATALFSVASTFLLVRKCVQLAALALLAAISLTGVTLARLERQADRANGIRKLVEGADGNSFTVTGWLDGPPEFGRERLYLSMRVESVALANAEEAISGRVSLVAVARDEASFGAYRGLRLNYGSRIRVTATLERAGDFRNPGVASLPEFLEQNGYDAGGLIKNPGAIHHLPNGSGFPLLDHVYAWRARFQEEIDLRFTPETAGVLDAALLGNRHKLAPGIAERFREGGTFHLLVISGLHISFIGALVFLGVRRLTRRRVAQFLLPALVVWTYSIAVGAEASVVRASLMFTFAGLAAIVFRRNSSLNALGGAALILLAHSPKAIFNPSFQLTFMAVLAIVAIGWPLLLRLSAIGGWYPTRSTPYPPACSRPVRIFCEILYWREHEWQQELARSSHRYKLFKTATAARLERCHLQLFLRYVFGAVVISAGVQLVLLPLMIVYFHRISPPSLLLNIVVSVLLASLITVALSAVLVAQVSASLAVPLIKLASAINWLMVHSMDPFSTAGHSTFRLPAYSGPAAWIYGFYYLPMLFLAIVLAHWQPLASPLDRRCRLLRYAGACSLIQLLLVAILIFHPFSGSHTNGQLRVDFLDVGQGDSALVTMPDGATVLIDGGGSPFDTTRRIGETVVSEYLWWRGLSAVDYVLVTHADADHIDGLNDVLKNFAVRGALVARSPGDDPEFQKFSQTLIATGTPVETIQAGDVMRFGDVAVSTLWPPWGGYKSANNDSIVLRIQFGERAIVFTGDIEAAAEEALLNSGQSLRADVIKVPHHGSKSSSTPGLVTAVRPTLAVISVGLKSTFGHPHKEVVERWKAIGANVLTTGQSGAITVTTDGHSLTLQQFQPQKGTKDTK